MKTKTIRNILRTVLLVLPATAQAGTDPYALSLEELMDIPVMVSSRKALSQRETPSSVSVITAEEIRNSGARDLTDVLRQVPGFDFRATVNNGLAVGMRGQIGSDGRVLMLVDGIDVNEHRYGSAIIGQGFPLEQIARIEIIRGSALALYGGTALLGVINIISKSADELNGVHLGAGAGMTTSGVNSREYASLMIGHSTESAVKFTAMAHMGHNLRSDRIYQDITGASFNMANSNAIRPAYLNMGLQAGDFSARYLHDETQVNDRDSAYTIRPADFQNYYLSDSLMLQQRFQTDSRLTFTPSLLYQTQNPRKTVMANGNLYSETTLRHLQAKLPVSWNVNANWHLAAGLEVMRENFQGILRPFPLKLLPFDNISVSSLYGEALWRNTWGDITASTRVDDHNRAGRLQAHRLGYTRIIGKWHVKLMGSYASRAPSMEGYATQPLTVQPERARTWEMETGYRLSSDAQLTVNLFDITTYDTLVLTNMQKVHTRGLEGSYKIRKDWGYADVSYSYYNAADTNTAAVQVIDPLTNLVVDSSMNLAFPSHKLTADLHYDLSSGFSLNPSLVYLGPRWGYAAPDPTFSGGTLKHFGATPLINIALRWDDTAVSGLDLTLGLYNALNKNVDYISPMNAFHAPLPGLGREVALQAQFKF